MKIGSLYTVKKCFWLLFPSKEIDALARDRSHEATLVLDLCLAAQAARLPAASAAYWSKQFEATYFSPDSIVVFLEEDGEFKKFLTSDGRVGWTWFDEKYHDCFEEVSS